jgi:septal ring factor EnvC (AmiA/AmiB activator)
MLKLRRKRAIHFSFLGFQMFSVLLLGACSSAPIKVTPVVDVKAVRVQNETTKKQIKTFKDTNKKTQQNVQKVQEEAGQERSALEQVKADLDALLSKKP